MKLITAYSFCFVCAFFALDFSSASAATIIVPDHSSTIQNAIDSAASGDTIIVRPGMYRETIDLFGKTLILRSEKGPDLTTIKGIPTLEMPTVTIANGEGNGTVIEGFTIMGGAVGIHCNGTSPTIVNNRIVDNTAFNGGGIRCEDGTPRILGNFIASNFAQQRGGGIFLKSTTAYVVNNIFSKNLTGNSGAGIDCQNSALIVANCTFVDNRSNIGGAMHIGSGSQVGLRNSILWDNKGSFNSAEIYVAGGGSLSIGYCVVQGWIPSIVVKPGGSLAWGPKNLDADPQFVDQAGQDYHLVYQSPCRNGGDETLVPQGVDYDFEGDRRVVNGAVDIGADEFDYRLYPQGMAAPGTELGLTFIGRPDADPVRLLSSPGLAATPLATSHGILFLERPLRSVDQDPIPAGGVLETTLVLPEWWMPGEEYYMQALVGPFGGPQTRLTNLLKLQVEDPAVPPNILAHDDGSGEWGYGQSIGGDFCWMHRFDAPPDGLTITHVITAFGAVSSPSTLPDGTDCTFFVWDDPDDDGDPSDCVLISSAGGVVAENNSNLLTVFSVPPAEVEGVFFIGCMVTKGDDQTPTSYDIHTSYQAGRSWYCSDDAPGGFDPQNLMNNSRPPLEMTGGHWLLRAGY